MAVAVYTGIQKLIRRFPNIDEPTALDLLDQVNRDLCADLPLVRAVEEDLSVVQDTAEYSLGDDVVAVIAARWVESSASQDFIPLEPLDPYNMDQEDPAWRARGSSTPSGYYVSGSHFGLYPKPDVSTSSGYPKVVQVLRKAVALTSDGTFPGAIRDETVYVEGASVKWAEQEGLQELPLFEQRYGAKVDALSRFLNNRNKSLRRQVAPRSLFTLRAR